MARCNRCNKFLWFTPSNGYCDSCHKSILEEEHRYKIQEENRRKEEERKIRIEAEKRKAEEQKRQQEEAKKYLLAVERNMAYISVSLENSSQRCLRLGEFRVSFLKGNGIRILLDPFSSSQHWFHIIGVMRYEGYEGVRETYLCGDLVANGRAVFDPFWVDGRGRFGMKSENAQILNHDLFELFPLDGEVEKLFSYALITYLQKSKAH